MTNYHNSPEVLQPAQLPVLNEVQAPSFLEHPWYIPHRDRTGYNTHSSTDLPVFILYVPRSMSFFEQYKIKGWLILYIC